MRTSKSDFHQVHRREDKERKVKGEGKLQPIRNMLPKVRKTPCIKSTKSTNTMKSYTLTEQELNLLNKNIHFYGDFF